MEQAVAALVATADGPSLVAAVAPARAALEQRLAGDAAAAEASAAEVEAFCRGATLATCTAAPFDRIGISATRVQGGYGVNSVVFRVRLCGQELALKGLICAHGPFGAHGQMQMLALCLHSLQSPPAPAKRPPEPNRARRGGPS